MDAGAEMQVAKPDSRKAQMLAQLIETPAG